MPLPCVLVLAPAVACAVPIAPRNYTSSWVAACTAQAWHPLPHSHFKPCNAAGGKATEPVVQRELTRSKEAYSRATDAQQV